jgi:hypothetical protein
MPGADENPSDSKVLKAGKHIQKIQENIFRRYKHHDIYRIYRIYKSF